MLTATPTKPVDAPVLPLVLPARPGPADPCQEGYTLLGEAWRSPTVTSVPTGRRFDIVRTPETCGAHVLDRLRRHAVRHGAVFTDNGMWHFFVPPRSDVMVAGMNWEDPATYVSGTHVSIPPRGARAHTHATLRWITREPAGHLFTAPLHLWAVFRALSAPLPAEVSVAAHPGGPQW
ncbi:hypothetical protein ACWD5R_41055 [Streptomyces sp. NPDC002514]|uniref:hypothetical protein n=1 Tax=Streptomyces sp. NPDC001270 TaxID=3364554 RepID=UPI0036A8E3E7